MLHPSDLAINGSKYDAARARAIVAEQLSFSKAYLTWTKEANELEDRLGQLWERLRASANRYVPQEVAEELHKIELDLQETKIQHEEWEVLFREKLLVERGLLQVMAGVTDRPQEPSEVNARDLGMRNITARRRPITATSSRLSRCSWQLLQHGSSGTQDMNGLKQKEDRYSRLPEELPAQ